MTDQVGLAPDFSDAGGLSRRELERLYVDERLTIAEIAATAGLSARTIGDRLAGFDIPRRPAGRRLATPLRADQVRRLVEGKGLSASEIARGLGVSPSTVVTFCRRRGIALRTATPAPPAAPDELARVHAGSPVDDLAAAYRAGATLAEIEAAMGVLSRSAIRRRLISAGVPMRRAARRSLAAGPEQ